MKNTTTHNVCWQYFTLGSCNGFHWRQQPGYNTAAYSGTSLRFYSDSQYGALWALLFPLLKSFTDSHPIMVQSQHLISHMVLGFLSKKFNVFISLIGAMLAGRIVMGIANTILFGIAGIPYAFSGFVTGAFVTALPGIIVQLVLIPIILLALKRTDIMRRLSHNG